MKILINNSWSTPENAQISIFSEALMYGFGIFETLRTNDSKKPVFLTEHINRLIKSCTQINLPVQYSTDMITEMVNRVADASSHQIQRIKVLAIPDYLIITSSQLTIDSDIYNGVHLQSAALTRSLPTIKSTAYLDCYLSWQKANKAGYYDALLIDYKGVVTEASRSNIVWMTKDGYQSNLQGVLLGVTIQMLSEKQKLQIKHHELTLDQMLQKNAVFLTNSIIGIVPVLSVNNGPINGGKITHQVSQIMHNYQQLITDI